LSRVLVVFGLMVCLLGLLGPVCYGAEEVPTSEKPQAQKSDMAIAVIALAAALAVGLCAIATGVAQSRIGAAGCGTISERPETIGTIIVLVAIPETMVILGFVVAIVMLFAL